MTRDAQKAEGDRPEKPVTEGSTRGVEVRDLRSPQAVVSYPLGETHQVRLAGTVVSRIVLQPGWSWLEHAQAKAGTKSCEGDTG